MKDYKIGIQLYSIREALKQDFKGVCRELVKLGCDAVEPAFYFGDMEPAELAAFFKEVGLKVCGIHGRSADLADPASQIYDYAVALNAPFVTTSVVGDRANKADYRDHEEECIGICRAAGEGAAKRGLRFTYHNHDLELKKYADGNCGLDTVINSTDPANVGFELDVYWVKKGGQDPVSYIKKHGSRIWQLHMKDMAEDGSITELGNGNVDLMGCIKAAENIPAEWLIYEQDYSNIDPFESAVISLTHLRKLLNK